MTPTPAAVAIGDAIRAILRDRPIEMSCDEIARLLDPQIYSYTVVLRTRRLSAAEVFTHCRALADDGYLVALPADPGRDTPPRFMWAPPRPGTRREHELRDDVALAALDRVELDEEPTT